MVERVVLLSIPQLRHKDVTPGALASLDRLAARGGLAELVPPFPALAAPSFATLMTGETPARHGLIGNCYFDREEGRVVTGPLTDADVQSPRIWQRLRAARPGARTMLWFAPNSRGADVDLDAWVDPRWSLSTEPPGLADDLLEHFGPFPCPKGPSSCEPPRLEATAWILKTAAHVLASEKPELAVIRVPYLGQIARRFGPDGREAGRAVRELESVLAPFLDGLPKTTLAVAVTESVITPVSGPIYPNRLLRDLGLLALKPAPGGGLAVDLAASKAFALVDHQVCHIYLNDPNQAAPVAASFTNRDADGVAVVAPGLRRAGLGMNHPRAGDVVLVAHPDRWFAPDWWRVPDEALRTAEHAAGLAEVSPHVPIDPAHVKGSMGAPPPNSEYLGVIVAGRPDLLGSSPQLASREVAGLLLRSLAQPQAPGRASA